VFEAFHGCEKRLTKEKRRRPKEESDGAQEKKGCSAEQITVIPTLSRMALPLARSYSFRF
jgi:hypothetical protein